MLKLKKITQRLGFLVCLWLCLIAGSGQVLANELGGTVKTEGVISFYEETSTSTTSDRDDGIKDGGTHLLPQTGEKINVWCFLLGCLLFLLTFLGKKYLREARE